MKIKSVFYSVWVLLCLVAVSCKKEDPKPDTATLKGSPVFSFTGNIDGKPMAIAAGAEDYFMSTSYALDNNGVYDFIGELKPKNCTSGCENSLKITIKDYRPSTGASTNIDSSITAGYYSYATPLGAASQYVATFYSSLQNGTAQTYSWDFGDGTQETVNLPSVTHKYLRPGVYRVSLTIKSTSGCTSTISNEIQFGQTGNAFLPQFQASIMGDSVKLIPIPIGGIPPYTYHWDFGDGATSTEVSPTHKYASSGVFQASLTMTDAVGVSSVQNLNVSIRSQSNTNCSSLFILPNAAPIGNSMNLSNVLVEWTDEDGKVWTSNSIVQSPTKSMFKITSVSDYVNNPNGDRTKKIHVQLSCTLYNGFRSKVMNNVDADFSVGYK